MGATSGRMRGLSGYTLDEVVKPPAEKPDVAESVIYGLIAVICIAVFAGVSAMLAQ